MKIRSFPSPSGSSMWRLYDPFKYLQKKGWDAHVVDGGITDDVIKNNDVFVLHGCVDKKGIAELYAYQQEKGKKIVVDMDDRLKVEEHNPFLKEHQISDAPEIIQKTLEIADMVTTTNEYLAKQLKKFNNNVVILPNYPDLERWDTPVKYKNEGKTLRIGWAGSITHMKDLEMIAPALRKIYTEFPQIEFIFVGETRVKELLSGLPVECMFGVPWDVWPTKLSGLRLDIALAPLVHNDFNKCKSRIKYYEYALAGIPGVYSPTVYDDKHFDGNFGLVALDVDHWYRCIKNMIISKELREDISFKAHGNVTGWYSLEKHIVEWEKAYLSLMN